MSDNISQNLLESLNRIKDKLNNRLPPISDRKQPEPECCCKGVGYYVRVNKENQKWEYALCPKCNTTIKCTLCDGNGNKLVKNQKTGMMDMIPKGCECYKYTHRINLLNRAKIPGKYAESQITLHNLKDFEFNKEEMQAFLYNQQIIKNFCNNAVSYLTINSATMENFFLLMAGPVGTGKSYLAVSLLKDIIWKSGMGGMFIDFSQLLQEIKSVYSKHIPEDEILNPIKKAPILVIDELGKGRCENEWELEKLDEIICYRYNEKKITILTTNFLKNEERNSILRSVTEARNSNEAYDSKEVKEQIKFYKKNLATKGFQDEGILHISENYFAQTLCERIGERLHDRLLEASLYLSFTALPSLRKTFQKDVSLETEV